MNTAETQFLMDLETIPVFRQEKIATTVEDLSIDELESLLFGLGMRPNHHLQKVAQAEEYGREMAKQAFSMGDARAMGGRAMLGAMDKGQGLRNTAIGAGVGATLNGVRNFVKKPQQDPYTGEQTSRLGNAARGAAKGAVVGGGLGFLSRKLVGGAASTNNVVGEGMRNVMREGAASLPGEVATGMGRNGGASALGGNIRVNPPGMGFNRGMRTVDALEAASGRKQGLAGMFQGATKTTPNIDAQGNSVMGATDRLKNRMRGEAPAKATRTRPVPNQQAGAPPQASAPQPASPPQAASSPLPQHPVGTVVSGGGEGTDPGRVKSNLRTVPPQATGSTGKHWLDNATDEEAYNMATQFSPSAVRGKGPAMAKGGTEVMDRSSGGMGVPQSRIDTGTEAGPAFQPRLRSQDSPSMRAKERESNLAGLRGEAAQSSGTANLRRRA